MLCLINFSFGGVLESIWGSKEGRELFYKSTMMSLIVVFCDEAVLGFCWWWLGFGLFSVVVRFGLFSVVKLGYERPGEAFLHQKGTPSF